MQPNRPENFVVQQDQPSSKIMWIWTFLKTFTRVVLKLLISNLASKRFWDRINYPVNLPNQIQLLLTMSNYKLYTNQDRT